MTRFDPTQVGWRLGRSHVPHGGQLWVPFDRTTGVYGPQGSGKTLDLRTPALLAAPGAAPVPLTKPDSRPTTRERRPRRGRPVGVPGRPRDAPAAPAAAGRQASGIPYGTVYPPPSVVEVARRGHLTLLADADETGSHRATR